jgi:hypothetical protein
MRTQSFIKLRDVLGYTLNEQREKRSIRFWLRMIGQHIGHNANDRLAANLPLI